MHSVDLGRQCRITRTVLLREETSAVPNEPKVGVALYIDTVTAVVSSGDASKSGYNVSLYLGTR